MTKRNDQSIYETYAHAWWDGSQRFMRLLANQVPARLAYFDRVAPSWQGVEVLDLGCGGGYMSEALAKRGALVTGVDPSPASLEAAREHAQAQGLEIQYRRGTGEAIPLATHAVDRVVCVDVLEHVQDLEQVLSEVHRVLRPGGMFLFDTINRNWLAKLVVVTLAEKVVKALPPGSHDPNKFIRPNELAHLLERVGLTVEPKQFMGMKAIGVDGRGDMVFGLTPLTTTIYLGYARSTPS